MIFANRYQGFLGLWYFIIDSTLHFENCLSVILLLIILNDEFDMLDVSFPLIAFSINVFLMSIRNVVFELRQRNVTDKINNKVVDFLFITRKFKRFVPIHWGECLPGYIIRVKSGQEFPADCLILDIGGGQGQKCYVTSGPFDATANIIQKRSYSATSNKSGSKN
jgi:magnesium-transporting ATPase (P-type)